MLTYETSLKTNKTIPLGGLLFYAIFNSYFYGQVPNFHVHRPKSSITESIH